MQIAFALAAIVATTAASVVKYGDRSSYGAGAGYGSGSGSSYGYAPPPPPPPPPAAGLDEVDFMFAQAFGLKDKLNTLTEQVAAFEARQSLQKRLFDEFVLLGDLDGMDENQDTNINDLLGKLDTLEELVGELSGDLDYLEGLTEGNRNLHQSNVETLAQEQNTDVEQDIDIAELVALVAFLPKEIKQALSNGLLFSGGDSAVAASIVASITRTEQRRRCEVGEVTLTIGDQVAEYTFSSPFETVPQIFYAVQDFEIGLNKGEDEKAAPHPYPSYGYGYSGYQAPAKAKEPMGLSFRVNAYPSDDNVIIEYNGVLAFGDLALDSVTVTFFACSIGPGLGPIH